MGEKAVVLRVEKEVRRGGEVNGAEVEKGGGDGGRGVRAREEEGWVDDAVVRD